jgi:prepilin-type N-terminal cleavage/methylation domain-containing protein
MTMHRNATRQRGYNLVELLVAMAILGTVMLSIISLFFLGRANVYSGKQMTTALSVATHASEDLQTLSATQLYDAFGVTATTATADSTVSGVGYSGAIVRATDTVSSATDPKGYLARWAAQLPATRISSAKLSVVIVPQQLPAGVTDPTQARLVQVRIVTQWKERARARSVFVDMSKTNRY